MSIKFTKKYSFAHRGVEIENFEPGQIVENPSPDLEKTATADGVIEVAGSAKDGEKAKSEPKKAKPKA